MAVSDSEKLSTVAFQFCGSGDMRGGVQDAFNTLGGYLAQQDIETHIFVGSVTDPETAQQIFSSISPEHMHALGNNGQFVGANGSQNPIGSVVWPKQARQVLHEVNPDVLHIAAPWVPYTGGLVLRAAQKSGIPTIATYHIDSKELKTNAAVLAAGLVDSKPLMRLEAMTAVSPVAREHLHRIYGYKDEVHIIPNAVDVERFAGATPFEQDEPFKDFSPERETIVFVGRPDERKGLDTLLRSFDFLRSLPERRDSQLIICGDGPELEKFQKYAAQLGIAGSCYFAGQVSDETKIRWLKTADFAVFPAKGGESQGIVLLEAMAAGSGAVLGGANRGYRSVLEALPSSRYSLFDPNDSRALAKLMNELFRNQSARKQLYNEQQQLVCERYDIAAVGKQITALYADILKVKLTDGPLCSRPVPFEDSREFRRLSIGRLARQLSGKRS